MSQGGRGAGRNPIGTYRTMSVLATGCAWVLAGTVVILLGYDLHAAGRPWAEAAVVMVVGLMALVVGLSLTTARLEVTPTAVVSHWGFGSHHFAVSSLKGVTVMKPGSARHDWVPGSTPREAAWGAAWGGGWGGGADFFAAALVLRALAVAVRWVAMPGTADNHVLHLVPVYGAPIPVRAISSREHDSASTAAAVAGVNAVVIHYQQAHGGPVTRWRVPSEPPAVPPAPAFSSGPAAPHPPPGTWPR